MDLPIYTMKINDFYVVLIGIERQEEITCFFCKYISQKLMIFFKVLAKKTNNFFSLMEVTNFTVISFGLRFNIQYQDPSSMFEYLGCSGVV